MGEDGAARPSIVGAFCLLAVVLCGAIALPLTNFTSPGRDVTLVVEDSSPAAQQKPFRASKRLRQLDKARHRGKGRGIPAVGINGSAPFHPEAKARQSRRRHGRGSRNNLWHRRRVPPPPPPPLPAPEVSGGAGSAAPAVSAPLPSATEDRAAIIAKRLEVARFCDSMDIDLPPQCRRPLPCDLRAFDPGPRFNRFVTQGRYGRSRKWAENNVDPASRHFQNGVEWWVHRALSHTATADASKLAGARRVFVAAYFSFLFIFAPHLAPQAAKRTEAALGRSWHSEPTKYAVAHGHPGSCIAATSRATRLLVDADLSCGDSRRVLPVPYVVSHPAWLVAAELPDTERTTLLFFRGHLPRSSIDTKNVRRLLMRRLAGQPGVVIEAATAMRNASYQPHEAYLQRMIRSTFCLAPRGDTASSRRVYEAIAAGCIPVIIADKLQLPFERRLKYEEFTLRISEADALARPLRLLKRLRAMPAPRIREMQQKLRQARPAFLWHTDPSRPSAVDQIMLDLCAADR